MNSKTAGTGPATLPMFLELAWARLGLGVTDRDAAARHPTMATIGQDGAPELRTVVLRGVDAADGWVEIHTDRATAKVAELTASPVVSFHVWDAGALLQIRLKGRATLHAGDAAHWAALPDASKQVYGVLPVPGTPIGAPEAFQRVPDLERFCRVVCHLEFVDLVHLGADIHRRAQFRRDDGWIGQWSAP